MALFSGYKKMPIPQRFKGKVAIVTASTKGIGFAIAERLAQEGASVIISSRKAQNVEEATKQLRSQGLDVWGIPCHVGKKEDRIALIEQTVKKYGGLDILVSNAATSIHFGPILEATEEQWDKTFDVNVKAMFLLIKEAVPYMKQRGGGSILLVASDGAYQTSEAIGIYCVSKTAVVSLTRNLKYQLSSMNIRVNCLAPGLIKTDMSKMLWTSKEHMEEVDKKTPLKRIGQPEECAGVAAFIVSDDATYMTGETVVVNGGQDSRL